MQIQLIPKADIIIPPERQRREFSNEALSRLSQSIQRNGLIHPIVIRKENDVVILVAGERRLRAMDYIWNFGDTFRCAESQIPRWTVPCILQGEMDPVDAYEMELEENIQREDITWQERAQATAALLDLRTKQAEKYGLPKPTIKDIALEVRADRSPETAHNSTREEILVAKHLSDPDVSGAKTAKDALKILKRKEQLQKSADLAVSVGKTFSSSDHTLLKGNCLDILRTIPDESFDVILTDPPYGIDAQDFGNSGGMLSGGEHFYDDSLENWQALMATFAIESYRLAKPKAHMYVFCDIQNFAALKLFLQNCSIGEGWKVFRTPLIWVNPSAMRAPWPEQGPQRKYQVLLYAVKGNRPVTRLYSDVLTYSSDENLNHPAQKPVDLYIDLLRRSVNPGDKVLDAFGGSGPILPAAHFLKCFATYIEQNESAFGIAVERLRNLK